MLGQGPQRSLEKEHQQLPHLGGRRQLPSLLAQQVQEVLELFGGMLWRGFRLGLLLGAVLLRKFPADEFKLSFLPIRSLATFGSGGACGLLLSTLMWITRYS